MPEKCRLVARSRQRNRALDLDASVRKDVAQLSTVIAQHLANQEPPMAFLGPATAAEQCEPMIPAALQQALNSFLECRLGRHLAIQGMPGSVVLLVPLGTAPQCQPEEGIANPLPFNHRLKVLPIEMRRKPRIGIRANVDEELDALALNERDEPVEAMVRVPNSPYGGRSRWHFGSWYASSPTWIRLVELEMHRHLIDGQRSIDRWMARVGIEPTTPRFSVVCSTN
jgi:hypothetical protein